MVSLKFTTEQKKVLTAICMAAFLVPFMGVSINLALPELSKELYINADSLHWVATIYLLSSAIFQIPLAKVADIIGRRKIFISGLIVFSTFTLAGAFSTSGTMLIIFRFLSGIGSAMVFGTNMAILTSSIPKNQRGKALGVNSMAVYSSMVISPILGGLLTFYFGWKSIFIFCAFMGLLVIIFSNIFLKNEWIESKGQKFDWIGSILYGISLFGIIYGFSQITNPLGIILLIAGAICLTAFLLYEKHIKFPILNVKLFSKNKVFAFSSLATLINYSATMGISFMMSLYLQYIKGFDARHAGFIFIAQALTQTVCSLWSGKLSDTKNPATLSTIGMSVIVAGLACLVFITETTPIYLIILILTLLGFGFGLFSSPNSNVIMSSVDKEYYSQASATMGTMRLTGQSFSMGIVGMIMAIYMGNNPISHELHGELMKSMNVIFLIFLGICILGVYASTIRNKKSKTKINEN